MTAKPFSFITETDLLTRLMFAQNHPANLNRDVMTFAGFCDDRQGETGEGCCVEGHQAASRARTTSASAPRWLNK